MKNWLKIHRICRNNFGARGVTSRNLFRWHAARQAWQFGYKYFGGQAPRIWENKDRPKFGEILDNFRIRSQISTERMEISKIGKRVMNYNPSHVRQKIG